MVGTIYFYGTTSLKMIAANKQIRNEKKNKINTKCGSC